MPGKYICKYMNKKEYKLFKYLQVFTINIFHELR